jgi:hypothetical protein
MQGTSLHLFISAFILGSAVTSMAESPSLIGLWQADNSSPYGTMKTVLNLQAGSNYVQVFTVKAIRPLKYMYVSLKPGETFTSVSKGTWTLSRKDIRFEPMSASVVLSGRVRPAKKIAYTSPLGRLTEKTLRLDGMDFRRMSVGVPVRLKG